MIALIVAIPNRRLAIAIPSLEGINWSSVQSQFENAIWAWALLAFLLYPLVPMAWATALLGCVNKDLPFVPTVLTQLAAAYGREDVLLRVGAQLEQAAPWADRRPPVS